MAIGFDKDAFVRAFGKDKGNDKGGDAIKFKSQNSDYRVYIPNKDKDKASVKTEKGVTTVKLTMDHVQEGFDPHWETKLKLDADAAVTGVSHRGASLGFGYRSIPIKRGLLELSAAHLDRDAGLAADGIGPAAAAAVLEDIGAIFDSFVGLASPGQTFHEDCGVNAGAMVAHNMARALTALRAPGTAADPEFMPARKLWFDRDRFGDEMIESKDVEELYHYTPSNHGWKDHDGRALHYLHAGNHYKSWRADVSQCRNGAALLVSWKIDIDMTALRDEHVIVLALFNRDTHFIAASAIYVAVDGRPFNAAFFARAELPEGGSPDSRTNAAVIAAIEEAMNRKYASAGHGSNHIGHVVRINLLAMQEAIKLG